MKAAILIAIAAALLAVAFLRSRPPTNHLDVTPGAREKIEKAKHQ